MKEKQRPVSIGHSTVVCLVTWPMTIKRRFSLTLRGNLVLAFLRTSIQETSVA